MNFEEIVDAQNELLAQIVNNSEGPVSAVRLGLDIRAGRFYVGEDFVVANDPWPADYYGGLEYVDEEATVLLAGYKVYSNDCERIKDMLEFFKENQNDDAS